MKLPTSKLAVLFFTLAAGQLLFIAYGSFQFYGAAENSEGRLLYAQFRIPEIFFVLVNPAFSLLAGFLTQVVKDTHDVLGEQLAQQEYESSIGTTDRIEP